MGELQYPTIGREHHPGRKVNICCIRNTDSLGSECPKDSYRIVYVKEGFGVFSNGQSSQIITSPSVLCLNESDDVSLHNSSGLMLDIMFFDPICFERYIEFESLQAWKDALNEHDWFFFRPFFNRDDSYIGARTTNLYLGNRVSQLIALADEQFSGQKDHFWPCRGRSYFIELLLLVNSIYYEDSERETVYTGEMNDEIKGILNWLHTHYPEKITMEVVTKQFHTNKTTLNQKFKSVMGATVMEYVNNLRMQIVCSFLRKTYLTINEIMERAGYRDDAHFLRTFRKYAGCTPSEYRNQYATA